jgi:hypothetical protein
MNLKNLQNIFGKTVKNRNVKKIFSAIFQISGSFVKNAIELLTKVGSVSCQTLAILTVQEFSQFFKKKLARLSDVTVRTHHKRHFKAMIIEIPQSNKFSIHNFVRDKYEKFFVCARFLLQDFHKLN